MNFLWLLFSIISWNSFAEPNLSVPKVNLAFWNEDMSLLWNNNCYNYSTNRVTHSFAQPGEASGKMYSALTCKAVIEAAAEDLGLTPTSVFTTQNKSEESLIALVVAPGHDFHWYRRDDNRYWSHKPGSTEATSLDQSDERITNPETADRGFYTDFCGYFKVKNYPHDSSEQDAGYVRIGNMLELPDISELTNTARVVPIASPNSEIEILIYSGRRNPRLSLEAFLESGSMEVSLLQGLAKRLESASLAVPLPRKPSRLGYNGILIFDHQGILFPKGTTVHLKGSVVVAYYGGRVRTLFDDDGAQFEARLRSRFPLTAP